ncbi:hypothetical protein BKA62DRAFT_299642 [Auriculariales sp. MPI-PUGE-AT-0066]|nr:hypothetical protein BKA62DRAFT_299642 [Auriculariales sp. MPI-PUGE-AT-0066]
MNSVEFSRALEAKAALSEYGRYLASLNQAAEELERNLATKRKEIAKAKRAWRNHRQNYVDTLPPLHGIYIRSLVPELLQAIFEEAHLAVQPDDNDDELQRDFDDVRARLPFTLATVNRYWRSVALCRPQFWTYVAGQRQRTGPNITLIEFVFSSSDLQRIGFTFC